MDSSGRTEEYLGRVLLSLAHKISLMEKSKTNSRKDFLSIHDALQTYEETFEFFKSYESHKILNTESDKNKQKSEYKDWVVIIGFLYRPFENFISQTSYVFCLEKENLVYFSGFKVIQK